MLEKRLHVQPKPAALDLASHDEVPGDATGQVARDGSAETKPDLINADDLSAQVYQGPAGIAAVNSRVVADPPDERADVLSIEAHPPHRAKHLRHDHFAVADDAECYRLR